MQKLYQSDGFGKEVKKRLIDIDMSQKELANRLGYSASYLVEILRGSRGSEKVKRQICEAVGLDYDEVKAKIGEGA